MASFEADGPMTPKEQDAEKRRRRKAFADAQYDGQMMQPHTSSRPFTPEELAAAEDERDRIMAKGDRQAFALLIAVLAIVVGIISLFLVLF